MNPQSSFALGVAGVVYILFVYYVCRCEWRVFLSCSSKKKFNYHITDMWAAIAGLTPSLAIAAYVFNHAMGSETVILCYMLSTGQIAGAFCGRLRYLQSGSVDDAWPSASMILMGALLGAFFVPLYLFCFAFVFPAVVVYLVLYLVSPALPTKKRA